MRATWKPHTAAKKPATALRHLEFTAATDEFTFELETAPTESARWPHRIRIRSTRRNASRLQHS